MPFRVEGQVNAFLSVGGVEAVRDIQTLEELTVTEVAGGQFPTIKIRMRTEDLELIKRVREDGIVVLALGDGEGFDEASAFTIQRSRIAKSGGQFWALEIDAINFALAFWMRSMVEVSDEMSGVERIRQVAERTNLPVDSGGPSSSSDRQRWIQYGCPHRVHLHDVWMRCDLMPSFPAIAHTLTGFRIRDVQASRDSAIGGDPDWAFAPTADPGSRDGIAYDIVLSAESRSGILNALGARGLTMHEHQLDTGELGLLSSEPQGLLAGHVEAWSEFEPVPARRRARSRNVHDTYWEAELHNRTQLGLHSSASVDVSWRGDFRPVRPLDVCRFSDKDVQDRSRQDVDHSGYYMVSRVARSLSENSFQTTVQMVREALGGS